MPADRCILSPTSFAVRKIIDLLTGKKACDAKFADYSMEGRQLDRPISKARWPRASRDQHSRELSALGTLYIAAVCCGIGLLAVCSPQASKGSSTDVFKTVVAR